MDVFYSLDDITTPLAASVLTMGTYDGLHRGHQEIIKHTTTYAAARQLPSVVITYDPHPRHVLGQGSEKLPLIMAIERKLSLLEKLSVDVVLIIPFDREFSKVKAREFVNDIVVELFHPSRIVIGYDHHFGHKRKGSPDLLKSYFKDSETTVDILEPVDDQGTPISSSHIRELITTGNVRRASFELGWVYGFEAQVIHGAGRGHDLNFPTANFIPLEKHQLLPKSGVYLTRGRVHGQQLYGMCNLGVRPTFEEGDFVMEVHFFDNHQIELQNLYGQKIFIEFLERIRDEKKFPSGKALMQQLEQDKSISMDLIRKYQ